MIEMKKRIASGIIDRFSGRLRELRLAHKLSQQKLAKKIGVTTRTILFYEQGKMTPSIEIAARLAQLFQVTTDELIFANSKKLEQLHDRELLDTLALADRLSRREKTIIKDMVEALAAKYVGEQAGDKAA